MFAKVPIEWFCLPDAQHKVLGVLLCHGSDKPVYPSVARIARYCSLSGRHVVRTMNELKRLSFIVEIPGRRKRVKQYTINDTRVTLHCQKLLGESGQKGDTHVILPKGGVTSETSKGDVGVQKSDNIGVTPNLRKESTKNNVRTNGLFSNGLENGLRSIGYSLAQIRLLLQSDADLVKRWIEAFPALKADPTITNSIGFAYHGMITGEEPPSAQAPKTQEINITPEMRNRFGHLAMAEVRKRFPNLDKLSVSLPFAVDSEILRLVAAKRIR